MKIDIVPAILPKTFDELSRELERLRGIAALVQVDLVGKNILAGRESLPAWEDFDFECDIMLSNPAAEVSACVAAGASRIIVHAGEHAGAALEGLQSLRGGDYPLQVGLALPAHGSAEDLSQYENLFDYVQVMGIDHIGRQGEPPDPHKKDVELVGALRARYPDLFIQSDGAAAAHIKELVAAGVNRLIVGSAIVRADDPKAALRALYTKANA